MKNQSGRPSPRSRLAHLLSKLSGRRAGVALGLALVVSTAWSEPQPPLPTIALQAGIHVIRAEVAADDTSRMRGLMFRGKLGPNEGMLFAFEAKARQCFWMRNTLIPLTIAFIDDDGRIVNLADMKPRSDTSHCSAQPVRYALEMSEGWFKKRGISAGTRLTAPPGVFLTR